MNDSDDIQDVREILEVAGLRVTPVEEAETRRCDLRACDESEQYLVEVKSVHDDEAIRPTLRAGEVYYSYRSTFQSRTVLNRIDEAVKQLRETEGVGHESIWFVAMVVRGAIDAKLREAQILGTLHGTRTVLELKTGAKARDCLYFAHSAFFRHRHELDGAIVVSPSGVLLVINDFSERVLRFRECRLGRFFADKGALNDMASLERGGYLVADCDFDRDNEHAVLQYLGQKYGLVRPIECTAKQSSAMIEVPRPSGRR